MVSPVFDFMERCLGRQSEDMIFFVTDKNRVIAMSERASTLSEAHFEQDRPFDLSELKPSKGTYTLMRAGSINRRYLVRAATQNPHPWKRLGRGPSLLGAPAAFRDRGWKYSSGILKKTDNITSAFC